jgi:hypothetical protein
MPGLRLLLVFVCAMAPWAAALPESASASFKVSARVTPRAAIQPLASPTGLAVSDADLARGQVEVEVAYQATSNDPRGFVVEVAPRRGLADAVVVELTGAQAVLTDTQLEFLLRDCIRCELRIRYRVHLRAGLAPGEYPLPWQVSARPI